jgi:transcriptional regulator with XRE-family HTH domain
MSLTAVPPKKTLGRPRVTDVWPTLSRLMEEQGLTDETLGASLGVTWRAVQDWRTGRYIPRSARLSQIARALHTDVATLISDAWFCREKNLPA